MIQLSSTTKVSNFKIFIPHWQNTKLCAKKNIVTIAVEMDRNGLCSTKCTKDVQFLFEILFEVFFWLLESRHFAFFFFVRENE